MPNFFSLNPRMTEKNTFCWSFFLKNSNGNIECSFDNLARKFLPAGWYFFAQCPVIKKEETFIEKKTFSPKLPYRHVGCRVDKTEEKNLFREAEKFPLNITKHSKNFRFLWKYFFFIKKFLLTSGMQPWKPCRKVFDRRPLKFCSLSRNCKGKRKLFSKKIPRNDSMDT